MHPSPSAVSDLTTAYVAQAKAADYARWAQALMIAGGDSMSAGEIFAKRWPHSKNLDMIRKAAVTPGSVSGWGEDLSPTRPLASAFIEFLRPRTVLGRLQAIRRVPFNVSFVAQTGGLGAAWVGEGQPIPVYEGSFERTEFSRSKIAGLCVLTKDLVRSSDPAAESLVQRDLGAAIIQFSDQQLLDPAVATLPDVSPASITNGATEIESTGSTAAAVEADLSAMVGALVTGGIALQSPVWVMKPSTALALARLRGTGGARIFPDVGPLGGTIWTIPVITSTNAGDQITLIDASEIMVADDGLELDASDQGTVQLNDAPDAPATASTVQVSLWQENLVSLRAVRFIRWQRRRNEAVVWMEVGY